MWIRSLLFGSMLAFVVTLVAACTITVGLSSWCSNLNVTISNTTLSSTMSPAVAAPSDSSITVTGVTANQLNTVSSDVAVFRLVVLETLHEFDDVMAIIFLPVETIV
jgi:hypothetical protein